MLLKQFEDWSNFLPNYSLLSSRVLTADLLNFIMGITPADNYSNLESHINWLSDLNGKYLKNLMATTKLQGEILGYWGLPKVWSELRVDALVKITEKAVVKGDDPDLVSADNVRIETNYAEIIKSIVLQLTKEDDQNNTKGNKRFTFDRQKCKWACEDTVGQTWLIGMLTKLQLLEWQYHSIGQTRLKAYKNLLRSLIQVITGQVISDEKKQPYRKLSKDGKKRETDEQYLKDSETRFLELLSFDAFDVRHFALNSPYSKSGFCSWEEVEGSQIGTTRLRYYPIPKGVKSKGRTMYMSTPLINRCDLFDIGPEKSVIEGILNKGYDVYMVDYGNPETEQSNLGLDFYGKVIHDKYLDMIKNAHPNQPIYVMGYCMGGTLIAPYIARRAEELAYEGKPLDIEKLVLMSTPIKFDDDDSGHKPMRDVIQKHYKSDIMDTFFGNCNVPPHVIDSGMQYIQPGILFSVIDGFFARANYPGALEDAAPFLNWLYSGTRFPTKAHKEWINNIFMDNQIWEGTYCLPSSNPGLDGKPVNMDMLNKGPNSSGIAIFDYRGLRDPIAPAGSCVTSERWGLIDSKQLTRGGLNRTIEKNIGHIFVVSKNLLKEYLDEVHDFLED